MNEYTVRLERNQEKRRRRGRGLSACRLKVIGAVLMLLSAASTTVIPVLFGAAGNAGGTGVADDDMVLLTIQVLCEAASWCAVPIYAWLLAQGYRHTHNAVAYGVRLLVLALVCEVPYDLATSGQVFDMGSQNPVFALLLALIVLAVLDWLERYCDGRPAALRWVLSAVVVVAALLWALLLHVGLRQQMMNAGALTIGFVLIFTLLGKRENTMMFTAGLLGAAMLIIPAIGVAVLHYRNGELGYKRPWTRWAFYAAYPVALLLCVLIAAIA